MTAEPLPRFAAAAPFAALPALPEPRAGTATASARWTAGLALAIALHGAAGLPFVARAPEPPAPDAPEAAVMIDLPAELALPPLESVASVAAPDIAAAPAETVPVAETDTVAPDAVVREIAAATPVETTAALPAQTTAALPVEAADALPVETARTVPAQTTDAAPSEPVEAATPPPTEVATTEPTESAAVAPVETAPQAAVDGEVAVPVETADALPVEIADAAPVEPAETAVVEVETVDPAPPVVPTRKPAPPQRRPVAEKPVKAAKPQTAAEPVRRRTETARAAARPAPSQGAVDGRASSGAGRPDPNAMVRYLSSVRADIMRQRRAVRTAGRGKVAVVAFSIDASGALGGVALAQSSGAPALDEAALAMVRRASPVPAMPAGMSGPLRTRLPVRFD